MKNVDLDRILDADVPAARAMEMARAIKQYLVALTEDDAGDEDNLAKIESAAIRAADLVRALEALRRRR